VLAVSPPLAAQTPTVKPLTPELVALNPIKVMPVDVTARVKFADRTGAARPATLTQVQTPGAPSAFLVETFSRTDTASAVEAILITDKPIKKGDVCLARFSVRALRAEQESGEAVFNSYFQQSSAPHEKSFTMQLGAGLDWTTYDIPFVVKLDQPAGETALCFAFGILPQSVEVASVQVLNFGNRAGLEQLPATRFSYASREVGAAWRTEALKRIEQIRTAPLQVIVRDAAGQPVEGARVLARLVQPASTFGTAMESETIAADTPNSKIYREKAVELFDTVTIGNGLKWQRWMGAARRAETMKAMDWIESQNLRLRGHT
jgi:hypothetical protein